LTLVLTMDFQTITVALLVGISFVYAAQALMPSVWRVGVMRAMARWPLPKYFSHKLAEKAEKASGCGCDGCDQAANPANGATGATLPKESKIIFMPRRGS
jgi:hypothetical protein